MLPRGYPTLLPPAGTGYSCFQSSFFPASWEKSVPMQQTGERWFFPGRASCLDSQSGFSVVKGCCDSVAHAPLLLFFPTAPHTEIPWHWEQWPSSSTPRGFEGIHQEGGFMPPPLQSGLALTSVQGLPKHLQEAAGWKPQPGRCTGSRAAPMSPSPAFPLAQEHRHCSHFRGMEPPQSPRRRNCPVPVHKRFGFYPTIGAEG